MTLIEDERPHNLMEALFEVRNSGRCNTLERSCVIDTLKSIGHVEVASWLEQHQESYDREHLSSVRVLILKIFKGLRS